LDGSTWAQPFEYCHAGYGDDDACTDLSQFGGTLEHRRLKARPLEADGAAETGHASTQNQDAVVASHVGTDGEILTSIIRVGSS
jgi:hypothetical protein